MAEASTLASSKGPGVKRGKVFAMRMAEAFFRRWPLYIIPVVLFIGVGVLRAKDIPTEYRSIGIVNVSSSTPLEDITDIGANDNSFETPAVRTARNINERMDSDTFAKAVADGAGLTTALGNGSITLGEVREAVGASSSGDNLLLVMATSKDPTLSQRLAQSLIDTYKQYVLTASQSASNAAVDFYTTQITADNQAVVDAQNALVTWVQDNPPPALADYPAAQQVEYQSYQDALTSAKDQLTQDQAELAKANLALTAAQADVNQRLQITDEPEVPTAPEATKLQRLMTGMTFLLIGLILVAAALVVAALLDKAVRSSDDITQACGLEVLAALPERNKDHRPNRRPIVPELSSGAA